MKPTSDRPTAPADTPDLELLRKFEPVVYYTKGEQVYPAAVEYYVKECSLWEHHPDGSEELLVPQGQMTMEKLVEPRPAAFGSIRYLRFIEALSLTEAAQVLANQAALRRRLGEYFRTGIGRLARGGFLPRLADGLFSLSFLLRGRVPAADMAAAELDYDAIRQEHPEYTYYGRVIRQAGWTVLQYWFFYYSNPWRSGFHGVNDHESDWEMISLYLYEDDGQLIPEWAAYASHDFNGDDLRRRWDDQAELTIENGHPVVHAGAGSHASYFRRGEYQDEVNLPVPDWFSGILKAFNTFWTQTLGQEPVEAFHVPFVDYARADGLRIGPDGPNAWSPVRVDESIAWVSQYHGLWGLFAKDPISGENAPAGPMYNRDGTPRGRWVDPLGFAGLDKATSAAAGAEDAGGRQPGNFPAAGRTGCADPGKSRGAAMHGHEAERDGRQPIPGQTIRRAGKGASRNSRPSCATCARRIRKMWPCCRGLAGSWNACGPASRMTRMRTSSTWMRPITRARNCASTAPPRPGRPSA